MTGLLIKRVKQLTKVVHNPKKARLAFIVLSFTTGKISLIIDTSATRREENAVKRNRGLK